MSLTIGAPPPTLPPAEQADFQQSLKTVNDAFSALPANQQAQAQAIATAVGSSIQLTGDLSKDIVNEALFLNTQLFMNMLNQMLQEARDQSDDG